MSAGTVSKVSPLEERITEVIQRLLDEKGATAADIAEWTGMGVLRVQNRLDHRGSWLVNELYTVALFLGMLPSAIVREAEG